MQPLWGSQTFPFVSVYFLKEKRVARRKYESAQARCRKAKAYRSASPLGHSRKLLAGIHPLSPFRSSIAKMDTRHKLRV
jgi:hypothetical protein